MASSSNAASKRAAAEELRLVDTKLNEVERQLRALKDERATLLSRKMVLKETLEARDVAADVTWSNDSFPWSGDVERVKREVFGIAAPWTYPHASLLLLFRKLIAVFGWAVRLVVALHSALHKSEGTPPGRLPLLSMHSYLPTPPSTTPTTTLPQGVRPCQPLLTVRLFFHKKRGVGVAVREVR